MEKQRPSTCQPYHASAICFALSLFSLDPSILSAATIQLSGEEAARIGRKIWQNECGGTIAGLTSWNEGENFASLGIGHFIWYPKNMRGPFEESFPKFLVFAAEHGAAVPEWLKKAQACPWNSRVEFVAARTSPQMLGLRQFLAHTVDVQTQFMVARLEQALPKMLDDAAPANRADVQRQFERVANARGGCYALVDYVNFKGEGSPADRTLSRRRLGPATSAGRNARAKVPGRTRSGNSRVRQPPC